MEELRIEHELLECKKFSRDEVFNHDTCIVACANNFPVLFSLAKHDYPPKRLLVSKPTCRSEEEYECLQNIGYGKMPVVYPELPSAYERARKIDKEIEALYFEKVLNPGKPGLYGKEDPWPNAFRKHRDAFACKCMCDTFS